MSCCVQGAGNQRWRAFCSSKYEYFCHYYVEKAIKFYKNDWINDSTKFQIGAVPDWSLWSKCSLDLWWFNLSHSRQGILKDERKKKQQLHAKTFGKCFICVFIVTATFSYLSCIWSKSTDFTVQLCCCGRPNSTTVSYRYEGDLTVSFRCVAQFWLTWQMHKLLFQEKTSAYTMSYMTETT